MFDFIKIPFKKSKEQIVLQSLCDQVKQFGFCKGPCLERHELCKQLDKNCLNIPFKCLVGIQLTRILSASHFYGRILKYSTVKDPRKDEDWINVDDLFEVIKSELKLIGSYLDTKILHETPVIGEMVMVEIEKEYFRAVILDVIHGWFMVNIKVKLIDLGRKEEIPSNKVFSLPNHLKEFRPVAIEIILSMEPFGEEESVLSWPNTTTKLVQSLFEPLILTNIEFICKVELTLGTTIWIDWILAKKCMNCSHLACKLYQNSLKLPRELIDRKLAKTTSRLIDRLEDLNKNAHVWKVHLNKDKPINTFLNIQKSGLSLFSCEEKKIKNDNPIQVQWAHLSENMIYNVSVDYIEHPKCFLVRNLQFGKSIYALQKDIDEAINSNTVYQLTCANVGTVCLALSPEENKYNRALVKQVKDQIVNILYVDYGEFCQVKIKNLLTIPSNLITKLPFQVIECNLSGFKDISQTDIIDQFVDRFFHLTNTNLCLYVLSSSTNAKLTGGNYYEIVLFNNVMNINTTMADDFNMYVDNMQIQNISTLNFKYDEIEDDKLDEEEFHSQLELLEVLLNSSTKMDQKNIELNSNDLIQDKIESKNVESNEKKTLPDSLNFNHVTQENNKLQKYVKTVKKYCLDCNTSSLMPQCFWHQDDKWLYIKLDVISVNNYDISHTTDTITVNIETNTISYFFKILLFAFIVEELFTCHVNFDGIYIKAKKLIEVKYRWPRLVKCSNRHKYIIYDPEYIVDHKSRNLWIRVLNKFKMKSHAKLCNVVDYDSDSYNSDSSVEEYTIFEDTL
ncbi:putative ATP-dependent RNA helicase TDRD12 [Sipha flava]|uniref:RNA helicase n=1 Tax=Sipha flava TaxID=143950 RepID=A0A2S2QYJ2_9HEMI|nr:putative ATP-dependent RNA helicase TDRD12 [Sipha flava]XP_025416835.1 putative ATP-dependent RNA helicase TDRD12 [Sipha flava]XP_025416843.1 putative ATP-dependent RNA helicase TDRD12 [Sipha flava]XP_025416850.1 putative ATP-dependent RNA helicase TDRD12 [Sipha flava]